VLTPTTFTRFTGKRTDFTFLILVFSCFVGHRLEPGNLSLNSDSLWALLSGNRIPVGARFSAPVQSGSEAHPASYTMDTVSLSGVKRPGRGVDHSATSRAEVNVRVELYFYSPSGPLRPVLGRTLPFLIFTVNRKTHFSSTGSNITQWQLYAPPAVILTKSVFCRKFHLCKPYDLHNTHIISLCRTDRFINRDQLEPLTQCRTVHN